MMGMHRSGTSALAGALAALGLDAGPAEALMPADDGNPEGYFEVTSIAELDEMILALLGGRWDIPPRRDEGWSERADLGPFLEEARCLVSQTFSSDRFVLKDPRMALLVPLWRQVLEDVVAVLIVREPAEVARSMARRDAMTPLTGLSLWAAYNRALLEDLAGMRVHVCTYEDLLADPRGVLGEVAASLESFGQLAAVGDLDAAAAHISADLRRSTDLVEAELREPPREIGELARALSALRGRHAAFAAAVPSAGAWEGALIGERRTFLDAQRSIVAQFEAVVADREARVSALEADNAALRSQSDELRGEMDAALTALRALEATRAVRWSRALARRGH